MTQKTFRKVAGLVFTLVAVLHLLRLVLRWDVVIDTWVAPMWVSWIAFAIAGFLAYSAFTIEK